MTAVEDDDGLVGLMGVPGVFLARNVALDLDASLVWQRIEDEVRDARRLELLAIYRGHAAFSFCERLREWNGHLAGISVSLRKYCWNSRVPGSP